MSRSKAVQSLSERSIEIQMNLENTRLQSPLIKAFSVESGDGQTTCATYAVGHGGTGLTKFNDADMTGSISVDGAEPLP